MMQHLSWIVTIYATNPCFRRLHEIDFLFKISDRFLAHITCGE